MSIQPSHLEERWGTRDDGAHHYEQVGTCATQFQWRVHGVEFKAQVLAKCEEPGASVAAIALAHGLNVNLLRKWLVGRGIKRAGLPAPKPVAPMPFDVSEPAAASLRFIPVELAPEATAASSQATVPVPSVVHVELNRSRTQLCVRWPSTQADSCAAWLRDLAATALKE